MQIWGGGLTSKDCPVIINAVFDFFLRMLSSVWTSLELETYQKVHDNLTNTVTDNAHIQCIHMVLVLSYVYIICSPV